jgi:hypothetical protein
MTPEKELEALIVTRLVAALPAGVQAVRKQQIAAAATLPRVSVACDVSTENQALAQVGVFSINVDAIAEFDAITGSDPASVVQQTINAVDATLLNWPALADSSVVCLGGTFGAGSTTNDEDRLVRTISGTLWARRRVVIPGTPSAPTGNMIVSGAGSVEANGVYEMDGENDGRPRYTKSGYLIEWVESEGLWALVDNPFSQTFYVNGEGEGSPAPTPDLGMGWQVIDGDPPAPTVTAEMSPAIPPVII